MSILSDSFEIRKLIAKRIDEYKIDHAKLCAECGIEFNVFELYVYRSSPNRVPTDIQIMKLLELLGVETRLTIVINPEYKPNQNIKRWAN